MDTTPPTAPHSPAPGPDRVVVAAALAGGGAAVAGALLLGAGQGAGGLAVLLVLTALVAVVAAPWRVGLRRAAAPDASPAALVLTPLAEVAVVLVGLSGAAALLVRPGLAPAALGGGLWLLGLATSALLAAAALGRHGQLLATGLGLLVVGLPYLAGPAMASAPAGARQTLLELTLLTPVPVLAGTTAGVDVLRGEVLYEGFPLAQALPYAYASPGTAAVAVLGAVAAALLALGVRLGLRPRLPALSAPSAPVRAGLGALALLLLAAAPARAQLVPTPAGTGGAGGEGTLQTRVQLGYWVPLLEGKIKLDGFKGQLTGSNLSFKRVLDMDPALVVPTFEVHLNWASLGKISLQYIESRWTGEKVTAVARKFEEVLIEPASILETTYYYRSISFTGELEVPILDFAKLRLLFTTRYVKHEVRIREYKTTGRLASMRNSVEGILPVLGAGGEVFIWGPIWLYGDIQWLDFRTSLFGGSDKRYDLKYLEWHAGARLELVEHAHISVEYFLLETTVRKGRTDEYEQGLHGFRLQVAILF
jgi:hypothetical protein